MKEKNKNELLQEAKQLADKHSELKSVVIKILDDMDKIETEYQKIIKEIKNKK